MDTTPEIREGYMSLPGDPFSIYTCVSPKTRCPGFRRIFNQSTMCTGAFDEKVPRCALCKEGYHQKASSCQYCSNAELTGGAALALKISVMAMLELLAMLYMYLRFNRSSPQGVITIGMVIGFLQTLYTLLQLPLLWPGSLTELARGLGSMLSIQGLVKSFEIKVDCIMPQKLQEDVQVDLILPLGPFACFAVLGLLGKLLHRPLKIDYVINVLGVLFKSLFISITGLTLKLLVSEQMPNGKHMIRQVPQLEYGSPEWSVRIPWNIAAFFAYCVTFISFVAHAVWVAPRRAAEQPGFVLRYRFAFGAFRPDRWYWILASLLYSFSLVVIQCVANDVHWRLYLSIFLLVVVQVIEFELHPFKFILNNRVELIMRSSLLIFLVIATDFVDDKSLNEKERQDSKNFFEKLAYAVLVIPMLFAGFAVFVWARKWCKKNKPVVEVAALRQSLQFRDMIMCLLTLTDKEFLAAVSSLGEADLESLKRAMRSITAIFFKLQPSKHLRHQRMLPGADFAIWDAGKQLNVVIDAFTSGSMSSMLFKRLKCHIALSKLVAELRGLRQSLSQDSHWVENDLTWIESQILQKGEAHQLMETLKTQHLPEMLNREEFCNVVHPHTSLAIDELELVFDFMDWQDTGKLPLINMMEILVAGTPPSSMSLIHSLCRAEHTELLRSEGFKSATCGSEAAERFSGTTSNGEDSTDPTCIEKTEEGNIASEFELDEEKLDGPSLTLPLSFEPGFSENSALAREETLHF